MDPGTFETPVWNTRKEIAYSEFDAFDFDPHEVIGAESWECDPVSHIAKRRLIFLAKVSGINRTGLFTVSFSGGISQYRVSRVEALLGREKIGQRGKALPVTRPPKRAGA